MRGNLAGNTTQLRLAIAELQELLRRQGEACPTARQAEACPTWQELAALTGFLEEALSHIEAGEKQAVRHYAELERRLLDIENSRFLRTLQWPGRFLGDWKGRLGQLLLHSPLHPLYLKLVHPHLTADRYRLWVESEPAPGQHAAAGCAGRQLVRLGAPNLREFSEGERHSGVFRGRRGTSEVPRGDGFRGDSNASGGAAQRAETRRRHARGSLIGTGGQDAGVDRGRQWRRLPLQRRLYSGRIGTAAPGTSQF